MRVCLKRHIDQNWSKDFLAFAAANPHRVGLSVLHALEGDTQLAVWPGSHLVVGAVEDPLNDAQRRAIQRLLVHVHRGHMVVFFQTLVHAGCGYARPHLRMHQYYDNLSEGAGRRDPNSTQYLKGRAHSTEGVFVHNQ